MASRWALSIASCDLVGGLDDLHAPAAAAERGLDGERPAVLGRRSATISSADCDELGGAGHDRRTAAQRGLAASDLVAHLVDRLGRRADERDAHAR